MRLTDLWFFPNSGSADRSGSQGTVDSVSEHWPAPPLSHRMTSDVALHHSLSALRTTVSLNTAERDCCSVDLRTGWPISGLTYFLEALFLPLLQPHPLLGASKAEAGSNVSVS